MPNDFFIRRYGPAERIKPFLIGRGKQIERDVEGWCKMPLEMTPIQALEIGISNYYPHPPPEFRDPIPGNRGARFRSRSPVRRFSCYHDWFTIQENYLPKIQLYLYFSNTDENITRNCIQMNKKMFHVCQYNSNM